MSNLEIYEHQQFKKTTIKSIKIVSHNKEWYFQFKKTKILK